MLSHFGKGDSTFDDLKFCELIPQAEPDAEAVAEKEPYPLADCEPVAVEVAEAVRVPVGLPVRDWPADAEAELEAVAAEEADRVAEAVAD